MPFAKTIVLSVLLLASAAWASSSPENAARDVVRRIVPQHVKDFEFQSIPQEDGRDAFELESRDRTIVLRGSSAGAMASAFNWYLEHVCHCQVSLLGTQLNLPEPLPAVSAKVRHVSPHRYRYWMNYCTFSYSLAFYDWPQWERYIDWMAMHGINMPLAVTGEEATWRAVCRRFGLSERQLAEFLPGPAYLPFRYQIS
jgi:alpha-N-acetylglucosaminidase